MYNAGSHVQGFSCNTCAINNLWENIGKSYSSMILDDV